MSVKKIFFLAFLSISLCVFILKTPAHAADTTDIPLSEQARLDISREPESSTEKFAREFAHALVEKKAPVEVEEEEEKAPAEDQPVIHFFVKKIILEGNSVITAEELAPVLNELEGKTITFEEVQAAAELITAYYRAKGYLTSRAYVPPQKIAKNDPEQTILIQILEGRVGEIKVEGNRFFKANLYKKALNIPKEGLLNLGQIQAYLLKLNQKSDRSAQIFIAKGEEPGTSDVLIKAEDKFPVHLAYEFSNRGTNLTHYSRHEVSLTHNNLTGNDDRLDASVSLAESRALQSGSLQYNLPIEAWGAAITLGASHTNTLLQKQLRPFDIRGKQYSLSAGFQKILLQTLRFTWTGLINFEVKDSRSSLDQKKFSLDQNRVITLGQQLIINDRFGRSLFSNNLHWGIPNFMGGSVDNDLNASRVGSGGKFTYLTGSLTRVHRLPFETMLILRTSGQWSPTALNSLELFRAGGAFSVRGYPESDSSGDSGFLWSAEMRVPPYFIPRSWKIPKMKDKTWREAFSFVGFVEGGRAFSLKKQSEDSVRVRNLVGTGVGLRFYLSEYMRVEVDYGFPIGDTSTDKDRSRFHLSAKVGF